MLGREGDVSVSGGWAVAQDIAVSVRQRLLSLAREQYRPIQEMPQIEASNDIVDHSFFRVIKSTEQVSDFG